MGGEDVGVAVGEDGEVVSFDVHEGEDDVLPAIDEQELEVAFRPVSVDRVGGVDGGEDDVVEEGLEGRNGGASVDEEGGEGVRRCDAEGEDLSVAGSVDCQ